MNTSRSNSLTLSPDILSAARESKAWPFEEARKIIKRYAGGEWPETVIFVIEDDPQDGGDHVDNHRSPLLVISPWARRGTRSYGV